MEKNKKTYRRYDANFKLRVILDMRDNNLSYNETARKYWNVAGKKVYNCTNNLKLWERIYLENGAEGLMEERRGRACGPNKGRPKKSKLPKTVEEDLIAENQRLRMEIEYLKKLHALVLKDEQAKNKKRQSF